MNWNDDCLTKLSAQCAYFTLLFFFDAKCAFLLLFADESFSLWGVLALEWSLPVIIANVFLMSYIVKDYNHKHFFPFLLRAVRHDVVLFLLSMSGFALVLFGLVDYATSIKITPWLLQFEFSLMWALTAYLFTDVFLLKNKTLY